MDKITLYDMLVILAERDQYFKGEVDKPMIVEWWGFFSKYSSKDFIEGVTMYRFESNKFPTASELDNRVQRAIKQRSKSDLEDRIAEHAKRKTQPTAYNPMDLKEPKLKEISKDILKVITQSGISPSAWRKLGKKYHDVPNPSEPGTKFGSFFEERAVSLECFIAKGG